MSEGHTLSVQKGEFYAAMKKKHSAAMAAAAALCMSASVVAPAFAEETSSEVTAQDPAGYAKTVATNAEGVANTEAGGTASITINGNANQPLNNKSFAVFMLFTAENSANGESISYSWNPAYKTAIQTVVAAGLSKDGKTVEPSSVTEDQALFYIQSLKEKGVTYPEGATSEQPLQPNQSAFRYFIQDLKNELVKEGVDADYRVNVGDGVSSSNSIQITGLQYGYYLVDEIYASVQPGTAASLCMVDTANPTASINIKSDYPTVDKTTFDDTAPDTPTNSSDYEIGQKVPFAVTSTVPNLSGYKTYPITFLDRMSKGLTLNPDSIKVTITSRDGKTTKELVKGTDWTFADSGTITTGKDTSVTLGTDAANNNLYTFAIQIPDLKDYVMKNFTSENNWNLADDYGQQIRVTYDATLNDQAVVGNPGNPNTISLIFNNSPDWEGDGTPVTESKPDTVVTFTFGMDNTKLNDKDQTLAGAKFRLYLDEACTKELYVKKSTEADKPNGYIVINPDSYPEGEVPADAVEMESDADGKFNIYGLDADTTYWLKETAAPEGYRPLAGPIKFTVTAKYSGNNEQMSSTSSEQQAGTADLPIKIEDMTVSAVEPGFKDGLISDSNTDLAIKDNNPATGTGVLPVVNQVGTQLPITGTPLVLLGSALTIGLAGAGAVLVTRKSKKKN